MNISQEMFGQVDGKSVHLFSLKNDNGIELKITNYGAIVTHILTPDKNGKIDDINLGFDDLQGYLNGHPYFGAIVGRFGNRIAKGKFSLDGKEYTLAINNGPNHLHGGLKGFDKVVWTAETYKKVGEVGLNLQYIAKDMEEGYPGNLTTNITYWLNNNNEFGISYEAQTDKATVLNLTNHNYYNLAGHASGSVLEQILVINADKYVPVDDNAIPVSAPIPVTGTAMDFTTPHSIGERIAKVQGKGYDHCYAFNKKVGEYQFAASAYCPKTGRFMEVFTTEPGVQLYTGNYIENIPAKGTVYQANAGFCFETQHYPDSPNRPEFPTTVLRPGEKYTQTTVHKFSIK